MKGRRSDSFPVTKELPHGLSQLLDSLARERQQYLPHERVRCYTPTRTSLESAREHSESVLGRMIALQEELDWHCYGLYGLADSHLAYCLEPVLLKEPPLLRIG